MRISNDRRKDLGPLCDKPDKQSPGRTTGREAMVAFTINGKPVSVEAETDAPLLWVIREHLKLTGTKYGCGIAQCGACTVHIDGNPTRSCVTPVSAVAGN